MADVLEVDAFADGRWVLAFDGRMLEISGNVHVPGGSGVNWATVADSWRIHVTHLNVEATGPDKKGYHQIAFCSLNHPEFTNGIVTFTKLSDTQRSRFQPLLDALAKASGVSAPGSESDGLLATKANALQALLSKHGVRLGSQPDDVRKAVVIDLQAAGVPIDPDSLAIAPTDPRQMDAMLEVYQRHGLLPSDASLG